MHCVEDNVKGEKIMCFYMNLLYITEKKPEPILHSFLLSQMLLILPETPSSAV